MTNTERRVRAIASGVAVVTSLFPLFGVAPVEAVLPVLTVLVVILATLIERIYPGEGNSHPAHPPDDLLEEFEDTEPEGAQRPDVTEATPSDLSGDGDDGGQPQQPDSSGRSFDPSFSGGRRRRGDGDE
jgi:hypothetical protein